MFYVKCLRMIKKMVKDNVWLFDAGVRGLQYVHGRYWVVFSISS